MRSTTWSRSAQDSPADPLRSAAWHHAVSSAYPAMGQPAHQRCRCGCQGRLLQPRRRRSGVPIPARSDRAARGSAELTVPASVHDVLVHRNIAGTGRSAPAPPRCAIGRAVARQINSAASRSLCAVAGMPPRSSAAAKSSAVACGFFQRARIRLNAATATNWSRSHCATTN